MIAARDMFVEMLKLAREMIVWACVVWGGCRGAWREADACVKATKTRKSRVAGCKFELVMHLLQRKHWLVLCIL